MHQSKIQRVLSKTKNLALRLLFFFLLAIFFIWITSGAKGEVVVKTLSKNNNEVSSKIKKDENSERKYTIKRKNIFSDNRLNKGILKNDTRKAGSFYFIGKMILMLLFVLLLISLISFIFKKTLLKKVYFNPYSKKNKLFDVIFTHKISSEKNIILTKVFDDYFLIGVTNNNINLISKACPSEEWISENKSLLGKTKFKDILNKHIKTGSTFKNRESLDIRSTVKNKLKNLKEL